MKIHARTFGKFLAVSAAVLILSGCNGAITDPDKDDDHDDESALANNDTPADGATGGPKQSGTNVCRTLVERVNPPASTNQCFLRANGQESPVDCSTNAGADFYWVKALSQSYNNVWVMVPTDDSHLIVHASTIGTPPPVYSPGLIYNGETSTFVHDICAGEQEVQKNCPVKPENGTCRNNPTGIGNAMDHNDQRSK